MSGEEYNNKTPVGCVATAMGQVMRYYKWPSGGSGSKTYTDLANNVFNFNKICDDVDPSYGTQTVNFSTETYNWTAMGITSNSEGESDIAKLLFDCGVSVKMDYSYCFSGAPAGDVPEALKTYFSYSPDIIYVEKSDFPLNWTEILVDEIKRERPIIFGGKDDLGNGHAFILMGYLGFQTISQFYINWGDLEGLNDGWWSLSDILYNNDQRAVINIHPTEQPDLFLSNASVSTSNISPGSSFNLSFDLANPGSRTADTCSVCFFLSADRNYNSTDIKLGSLNVQQILEDQLITRTKTLQMPEQPVGVYYILAYADYYHNVHEFVESDNVISVPINVSTPGQIIISSAQLNKTTFTPGENATLTINLAEQLAGATVTYKIDNGSSVTCTDVGNGVYQKTFITPTTTGPHSVTVSAVKSGFLNANPYTLTFQIANAGLSLTANPSTIQYTGSSTSTITGTLLNAQGQPMTGVTITFLPSESLSGSVSPGSAVTNSQGVATTTFSPGITGTHLLEATAQTTNNPTATVQVVVTSAGSSTYTIKLSNIVTTRTETSVTHELIPYVTFTSSGEPVDGEICTLTTNLGTFQNATQTYSGLLGDGGYGDGQISPHPLLTTILNGTATITITVGPSSAIFTLPMTIGLLPQVQPFYTLTNARCTDEAERELDWSADGKLFAYTPGRIVKFPSFESFYSGPSTPHYTLSFSKTGKYLVMGRYSDNPVYSIYNTTSNTLTSSDPNNIVTGSMVWSSETDDYKFALGNTYSGYMNQIIIYTGTGLVRSYLYIDGTTDQILAMDWKGDYLVATTSGGSVYLFNTATMTRVWKATLERPFAYGVSISPDKSKLAVLSRKYSGNNNLYIFNVSSSTPATKYGLGASNGDFYSVDWSPDGSKIVAGGSTSDSYLRIIDASTGTELYNLTGGGYIWGVSWGPHNIIASIYDAGTSSTVKFYAPFDTDGPEISVSYPGSGFCTVYDTVNFKGNINDLTGIQSAQYRINSGAYTPLTVQSDGSFSQSIAIDYGQNEIRIQAADRGGRITELSRTVTRNIALLNTIPEVLNLTQNTGASGTLTVTSNTCWSVTNPNTWLNIAPTDGCNDQIITITAISANMSTSNVRTGTITISGAAGVSKTVTVNQGKLVVLSDAATNDANVISLNDVTLNGFVNANNSEAVVSFEYGTSTGYGQAITAIQNPVTGSSPVSVSATISGLETGVVYHFRVKATNSAGTVYGEDKTFTVYTTDVVDIDPDEITIYPNPTSGIFRISGIDNCIVKIIDITGKPVLTKSIKADNTIIDLTGHSKGIYMIILLNNSGICYNRVLIY